MNNKNQKRKRLKLKIRAKVIGTIERPRLSVFRSNKFIYAQAIDDHGRTTVAQADDRKIKSSTKMERSKNVGKEIAEKLLNKKIDKVVFDRNRFKYTGRVKALAEAARTGGLKF